MLGQEATPPIGLGSYIFDSFVDTFIHHLSEFVDDSYFELPVS